MGAFFDDGMLRDAAVQARHEWRSDEEAWTRAAFERWCHGRTLVELAREHLHRGDIVTVLVPHLRFTGTIVGTGDDVVALAVAEGRVDVNAGPSAAIAWRVVVSPPHGGTRGELVGTLRARLLELEAREQVVEIGTTLDDVVSRGRITVGRDHVIVDDEGAVAVVALAGLAWVRAAP